MTATVHDMPGLVAAIEDAARTHHYLRYADHADGNTRTKAIAAAGAAMRCAIRYAERAPGYRDAVISADGFLVILCVARETPRGGTGVMVTAESLVASHRYAFATTRAGLAFLDDAQTHGLGVAAHRRGLVATPAPAGQADLFAPVRAERRP
jgi:hypothetical protein